MILDALIQFLAAFFGTIAFSVIFLVPREHYLACGVIGGLGWLFYWWLQNCMGVSYLPGTFFAAAFVVLLSRICGVEFKCPTTIFLSSGIFPLVPGVGIYRTVYYMIIGEMDQSSLYGRQTIGTAIAIVFGIIFVFEIPQQGIAKIAKVLPVIRKKD
ncbi:MAG: threonine/serine exporter family protein [Ruminococcus sp.]|jgi:uncharacterized membrane protein YjjB (DUF3815 family)